MESKGSADGDLGGVTVLSCTVVDFKLLGGVWSLLLFKCEMTAAGSMAVSNSVLFLTLVCEKSKLNFSTGAFGGD